MDEDKTKNLHTTISDQEKSQPTLFQLSDFGSKKVEDQFLSNKPLPMVVFFF